MEKNDEKIQKIKKESMMTIIIGLAFIIFFLILYFLDLCDAMLCITLIIMVVITCVIYLGLCIKN